MKKSFKCPVCKKQVQRDNPDFPFCSGRCRLIDLGKWADGDYRVASEPAMPWEELNKS
jgi:endogenous inhibitor of DNA gyrase (YacG/DUF329 family)